MEINSPTQLNGVQLQKELKDAGIILKDYPRLNNGILILEIDSKDEAKATLIVKSHVGIDNSAEIIAAKNAVLDKLGINADEAALLLS